MSSTTDPIHPAPPTRDDSSARDNSAPQDGTGRDGGDNTVNLQIIGGGLAGLIAANLALDAGLSVRLIESQPSFGGRACSAERQGFTLNQGPHALYVAGELRAVLQSLGIDPHGAIPATKGATGSIGSTVGLLPQGPLSLLRTSLLPPRGKRQLMLFMARLPGLNTDSLASTTVARWLEDTTDVPELQALLTGLINLSTYTFAPDILSAGAALKQLQMALDSNVLYLDGGWATIVDALADRLGHHRASAEGRFHHVQAKVTALRSMVADTDTATYGADTEGDTDTEGGTVQLAEVDGGRIYRAATVLIACGSPALADRLLGQSALAEAAGPPVRAAVLDLGVRTEPSSHVHLGLDRGLYLSTHSVAKRLAPEGTTLVSVARYLRPGDQESEARHSAEETRAVLLAHAREAGIAPDDIVMERYLHRLTVTHGLPLAERGGLAGRPSVADPARPGVFIAGDWVGDTGLLADASVASAARAVARAIEAVAASGPTAAGRGRDPRPVGVATRR